MLAHNPTSRSIISFLFRFWSKIRGSKRPNGRVNWLERISIHSACLETFHIHLMAVSLVALCKSSLACTLASPDFWLLYGSGDENIKDGCIVRVASTCIILWHCKLIIWWYFFSVLPRNVEVVGVA